MTDTFIKFEKLLAGLKGDKAGQARLISAAEQIDTLLWYIVREHFTETKLRRDDDIEDEKAHEKAGRKWYIAHNAQVAEKVMTAARGS
jgi:hypothetical protein